MIRIWLVVPLYADDDGWDFDELLLLLEEEEEEGDDATNEMPWVLSLKYDTPFDPLPPLKLLLLLILEDDRGDDDEIDDGLLAEAA